jgi:hypothetical protein
LVDARASQAQQALLNIVEQRIASSLAEVRKLTMPVHHDVRPQDIDLKRLGAVLAVAHEQELRDFASLLLVEGLGPRTLQSLALIAEVVHGAPSRFSDPARFSFAHGGKDGHPFPVPLKPYDESIAVLRRALDAARLGQPVCWFLLILMMRGELGCPANRSFEVILKRPLDTEQYA